MGNTSELLRLTRTASGNAERRFRESEKIKTIKAEDTAAKLQMAPLMGFETQARDRGRERGRGRGRGGQGRGNTGRERYICGKDGWAD